MILLIATAILFIAFFLYSMYKEKEEPVLRELQTEFFVEVGGKENMKCKTKMFFFKYSSDKKFDYLNSAEVSETEDGIWVLPSINHCFLKPMFFPSERLVYEGRAFIVIGLRKVYKIKDLNLKIAL